MNHMQVIGAYRQGALEAFAGAAARLGDYDGVRKAAYEEGFVFGSFLVGDRKRPGGEEEDSKTGFVPDYEGQKPVQVLNAEELLKEIEDLRPYRGSNRIDIKEWVFDRLLAAELEMKRRLESWDERRIGAVASFSRSAARLLYELWAAHGGRELRSQELEELTKSLFYFYAMVR